MIVPKLYVNNGFPIIFEDALKILQLLHSQSGSYLNDIQILINCPSRKHLLEYIGVVNFKLLIEHWVKNIQRGCNLST